jgi:hypothetical protein
MGIEPTTLAWKAKVIPFYDTRINISMHSPNEQNYLLLYTKQAKDSPYKLTSSWCVPSEFKLCDILQSVKNEFVPADKLVIKNKFIPDEILNKRVLEVRVGVKPT